MSSSATDQTTATTTQNGALPSAPAENLQSGWTSLVPMVLIFVVFYFLLIRPQDKKRRAQEELVNGVKKGEEVLTHSGIYGVVAKINDSDNTVDLTVTKDVTIKILKSSIADIISRKQQQVVQASAPEEVKQVKKPRQKK